MRRRSCHPGGAPHQSTRAPRGSGARTPRSRRGPTDRKSPARPRRPQRIVHQVRVSRRRRRLSVAEQRPDSRQRLPTRHRHRRIAVPQVVQPHVRDLGAPPQPGPRVHQSDAMLPLECAVPFTRKHVGRAGEVRPRLQEIHRGRGFVRSYAESVARKPNVCGVIRMGAELCGVWECIS